MKTRSHQYSAFLVLVLFTCGFLPVTAQATRACKTAFSKFDESIRLRIREMAELRDASMTQDAPALMSASEDLFQSRYDQMVSRIGVESTLRLLRTELWRLRRNGKQSLAEERVRKKQRMSLGFEKFRPKLLSRIEGQSVSEKVDDNGFPDGSFEFKKSNWKDSRRMFWNEAAPWVMTKQLAVPERTAAQRKDLPQWTIRQIGPRLLGFGPSTSPGLANGKIEIWDVAQGKKTRWTLPKPSASFPPAHGLSISPNGKYLITIDASRRLHRLDFKTGKIDVTDVIESPVGAMVRDDGSVIVWLRSYVQMEFASDLSLKGTQSTGFFREVARFDPAPDQTHAVIVDTSRNVFFYDLKKGLDPAAFTRTQMTLSSGGEIIWKKNQVWIEYDGILNNLPRDPNLLFTGLSVRKDALKNSADRFVADLTLRRLDADLIVTDLETGTQKKMHLNKAFCE